MMHNDELPHRRCRGVPTLAVDTADGNMVSGQATDMSHPDYSVYHFDNPSWTAYFNPTFSVGATHLPADVSQQSSLGLVFPTTNPEDAAMPIGTYSPSSIDTDPHSFTLISPHLTPSIPVDFRGAGIPTSIDGPPLITESAGGPHLQSAIVSPISTIHPDFGGDDIWPDPSLGVPATNQRSSQMIAPGVTSDNNRRKSIGNLRTLVGAAEVEGGKLKRKYKGTCPDVCQSITTLLASESEHHRLGSRRSRLESNKTDAADESRLQHTTEKHQSNPRATARARNRAAATKCRAKSKVTSQQLKDDAREVEEQHRMLIDTKVQLEDMVWTLNIQLLEHHGCGDRLIDQYIQHSPGAKGQESLAEEPEYQR